MGLQDLMVPNHNQNGVVYPNDELMVKRQSGGGISGKQKQGIQKQLVELLKRDLDGGGSGGGCGAGAGAGGCGHGGENLVVPRTPTTSGWQEDNGNENAEGLEPLDLGNRNGGVDGVVVSAATSQPLLRQQAPFTSLLMMPEENRGIVDGDMLWNSNPHGQSSQVLSSIAKLSLVKRIDNEYASFVYLKTIETRVTSFCSSLLLSSLL